MFTLQQMQRYADVLVWGLKTARSERFKKNDIVLIRYDLPAVSLAEILYAKILEMGMHPVQRVSLTSTMEKSFYSSGSKAQLVFQTPGDRKLLEECNGYIVLHGPESITHLQRVDPRKISTAAISRKYLRDIMDKREAKGEFGWTLCTWPTEELAEHAGMTVRDYAGQIVKACFLNKRAPIDHWKTIFKNAQQIKKWLNRMDVAAYRIESRRTDLTITPGRQRKWIGISGHNIPSFELFLSPDWRGTSGVYYADQPSYRSGNLVEGVRLEFKKGVVTSMRASKGEKFVQSQLSMDKGASRVGEFSLTDKRFSKIDRFMANTLFDENFGGHNGNCHIALGASYADTFAGKPSVLSAKKKENLGFNDSALHWDLVNTEKKRVTARLADGKEIVIYENGQFKR